MSHVKTDKLSARTASGTITLGESGETFALGSGATVDSGFTPAAISINASASSGALAIDASDNLQFDSGYGSTATAYGCRAWVNFNGTGTLAIRDSANVSSVTDNGIGDYTVNFSTSMPDANYCVAGSCNEPSGAKRAFHATGYQTSDFLIYPLDRFDGKQDADYVSAAVFR
jgi:hypothetical protein